MYRTLIRIKYPKLNPKKYDSHMNKLFLEAMQAAAKAFVEEAAPRVPVDTGMARGTFLNVSRALRIPFRVNRRKRTRVKWYGDIGYGDFKGPLIGTKYSSYKIPTKTKPFEFRIQSQLLYFMIESIYGRVSPTAPWHPFKHGKEAFREVFYREFKKRFDPDEFMEEFEEELEI